MRKSIKVLEQIQRIDLDVKAIEEEEKRYIKDIGSVTADIGAEKEAVSAAGLDAEELKGQIKALDEKIRESSEKVAKDEKRLNEIKNEREMNALTKEINAANKAKKQSEQEKNSLSSKLEDKRAALEAKGSKLNEKESELKRLTEELEAKKAGWKEEIDKKLASRDSVKKEIRPEVLKRYETVKAKRGGVGLVAVKSETCQGCFIHIPPQVYIQLKRGTEELISCPHCHRILYAEGQDHLEAV